MSFTGVVIPQDIHWSRYLKLSEEANVDDLLKASLLQPLDDFLGNSGKNLRARLVELGLRLSMPTECEVIVEQLRNKLSIASSVVEAIHSGSLIIDDIQDGSAQRRQAPAFHMQHGVPLALNAGNWLYFWALEQLERLELSAAETQQLLFRILKLMTRAHFGQALDLGTSIDTVAQNRVSEVCLASMELKTGTLFNLASILGSTLNPAENKNDCAQLFSRLGVALQALDDVGNFLRSDSKRLEDLRLRRPGWVWHEASKHSPETYQAFLAAVEVLPDETQLVHWCERHAFNQCLEGSARELLKAAVGELRERFADTHPRALQMVGEISSILEKSYV